MVSQIYTTRIFENELNYTKSIAKEALKYQSAATIQKGQRVANAKSVLAILALHLKDRDSIEIICQGEDEKEAIQNIGTVLGIIQV